jgi:cytochrome c oxidase subunit 2
MRNRPLVQAGLVAVVATALGIALGLGIRWFPEQASTQAHRVDTLYDVLIVASVPMFVLVVTVVLFSVWKFRMRPGEETKDGPPIHGNTRLEVLWTAFPAVLLISLCSYAYVVLTDVERKPAGREMYINVTSQQFAWSFEYPAAATGGQPMQSTELYLPKDQPVQFKIQSKDVIHAFFVPAFRVQIDAVPGQTSTVRATPSRIGDYPLICAELCGLGHSTMRSTVHVVTPAAFTRWLKSRQAPGPSPSAGPGALAAAGKTVFTGGAGCGGCHTLADAGTSASVGPDLGKTLGADAKRRGKPLDAFIRESITAPNAFLAPGYPSGVMPQNFGSTLSKAQVDGLVAYLTKVTAK